MNKYVKSVLVLTIICIIVGTMLAITNYVTGPIIADANRKKSLESCFKVMTEAEDFKEVDVSFLDVPSTITNVYKEKNHKGFVFRMKTNGYKSGLVIMCGISNDGKITGVTTLASEETVGIGKKTEDPDYESQYIGKDKNLKGVEGISGATITSTAYKKAINDAFKAFSLLEEAQKDGKI